MVWISPLPVGAATSTPKTSPSPLERDAMTFYRAAEYSRVIDLIQHPPTGQEPSLEAIRYAILSYVKMGKPEEAWKLYPKLTAGDRPDDPALLREIARAFIVSRVRDSQEHIRIAAYTALAEMGEADTLPFSKTDCWILRHLSGPGLRKPLGGVDWQDVRPRSNARFEMKRPACVLRQSMLSAMPRCQVLPIN